MTHPIHAYHRYQRGAENQAAGLHSTNNPQSRPPPWVHALRSKPKQYVYYTSLSVNHCIEY
ncbi:hypothetical protein BDR22DRAFT_844985 [Usnea florida]